MRTEPRGRAWGAKMVWPAGRASWWAVGLYPAAWLFQTAVGDALHQLLHFCSRHGTLERGGVGAGAAALRRLLGCIGYIHTCHHSYIDAFGNVDPAYQWQNIWLDKVLKRAIHQALALGCWRLLLRPLAAPALAAAGRRAMLELVLLEGLRTAWAVWLALPSRAGKVAAVVSADHPSLSRLPADGAARLAKAVELQDGTELLLHRLWITPTAHALHHFDSRNFPNQYIDWRALCVLLGWAVGGSGRYRLALPPPERLRRLLAGQG